MTTPKPQAYPASRMKVGAILYVAEVEMDEHGKATSVIQEWIVRSIRAKRGSKSWFGIKTRTADSAPQYVNLTQKVIHATWGKRSSKTGDYGWLPNPASCFKTQFRVGADLPYGMYTTPRAAVAYRIAYLEDQIDKCKQKAAEESEQSEMDEWLIEVQVYEAQLASLKRRLSTFKQK